MGWAGVGVGWAPNFITGFVDGEGCFEIAIQTKNLGAKGVRYNYNFRFSISQHKKDRALLEEIQKYFGGVGSVTKLGEDAVRYQVGSLSNLALVINHFDKYPLITQKQADYLLFKQAFDLVSRKEHLTKEGFNQLLAIKASINKGFSEELKKAFPDIVPVKKSLITNQIIKDPYWLAGFASGEGCFLVCYSKSSKSRFGFQVQLIFSIYQHTRDAELMGSLAKYFGCGR